MENSGHTLPRVRLVRLVEEILAKTSARAAVAVDDELAQIGLTSLDMVSLMLGIEAEFDLMIPASRITPANFRSVATIEAMIIDILSEGGR